MPNQSGTSYILTSDDVTNAFNQCINCEFVRTNPHYNAVCTKTFITIGGSDAVNAYSVTLTDALRAEFEKQMPNVDWKQYNSLLVVTTGMIRWVSALANVCEYMDRKRNIGHAKKMLKWMSGRLTQFCAGSDFTQRFLDEFGVQCNGCTEERVRMYAIAILIGLIGHELGHSCLGHYWQASQNSISRNNEKCADMFASSIVQSIGNGYVGAIGTVMLDVSFVWMNGPASNYFHVEDGRDVGFGTHPVSSDRVRNFVDSFNAVLAHSPVTGKMLMSLCECGK